MIASAVPPLLLLAEVTEKFRTPRSLKLIGLPALILFLVASGISTFAAPSLAILIGWGLVAGLIATVGLDTVRISGYLFGYMPLDLPLRFGSMALGLESKFKLAMMGNVLPYAREEAEKGRQLVPEGGFIPKLSVPEVKRFVLPSFMKVMKDTGISRFRITSSGYLWHYINGMSFGVTHAILLGSGRGILPLGLSVGFGLLLATVFLLIIRFLVPIMKPGVKLPIVVYLAHINVIWVLVLITQTFVPPEAEGASLFSIVPRIFSLFFGG